MGKGASQPLSWVVGVQGLVSQVTAGNWWTHKCGFAGARGSHDCNHALGRTHTRDIIEDCQTAVTAVGNMEAQILKPNLAGVAVHGQAGCVWLARRPGRRHGSNLPHLKTGLRPLFLSQWPINTCTWTGVQKSSLPRTLDATGSRCTSLDTDDAAVYCNAKESRLGCTALDRTEGQS